MAFERVRAELGLPPAGDDGFPPAVLAEAERVAAAPPDPAGREDATALELVTIDPPGSRDLDQALHVVPHGDGWRVHYAIADLGAVVAPGGAIDAEGRRRGQTLYVPDGRVPLHPAVLSEGAASLLPGEVRRAALWTIDVASSGEPTAVHVRRALVRSTAQFDYAGVQADLVAGRLHPSLAGLPGFGRRRRELAVRRGAIELQLPEQEVVRDGAGWRTQLRLRTEVDAWNAEVSLLTGTCAAQLMITARVGLLRTLPAPEPGALDALRRSAAALGLPWPDGASPAEVLAGLDPADPRALALMTDATRLLRGAGYVALDGAVPDAVGHAGIGAPYAHVTAPIRRLVDRFGTEVCLAVAAGEPVPEPVRAALAELPAVAAAGDARARDVDRACLAQVEAEVLAPRVGQRLDAVVLRADDDGDGGEVFVPDPPVIARCTGGPLREGARTSVVVTAADPVARTVTLAALGS